ncbi:MAG: PASTA domain-containing protein [Candidatus Margulisiibacteriota bacterium]|jgi:serine/threonine-protein kinase
MTGYLALYLVFAAVVSLVIGLLVVKLRLPAPRLVIPAIIIFILSPVLAGYIYLVYFDALPEVAVPDVVGLSKPDAAARLKEAELKVLDGGEVYQNFPAGTVVSQRPEAGRRVKVGRAVTLMVSSGKQKVAAPDLIGKPFSQAAKMIDAAELKLGDIRRERNPDLTEGTVLAQEPLPGEMVDLGRGIDLLISTTGIVTEETE